MNTEEFQTFAAADPAILHTLRRAAQAMLGRSFSLGAEDALLLVAFFPIVRFVVSHVGLPWLHSAARYSELWRQRVDRWIDEQYQSQGFDADQAEAAAKALREELEKTTDKARRKAWEQLRKSLGRKKGSK